MPDKYNKIASTLCDITTELLNDSDVQFNGTSLSNIKLTNRIGSGLATYCKYDRNNSLYTITYGKKMIKSKLNQNELPYWLTYREILKYNYFDNDISITSILSHTICHEFSHLLQQHAGWHIKGSVHSARFYEILSYMHDSGIANKVKNKLITICSLEDISLDTEIVKSKSIPIQDLSFDLNDKISFEYKSKIYDGIITKINRKTLIVKVPSLFRSSIWKIPKYRATKK